MGPEFMRSRSRSLALWLASLLFWGGIFWAGWTLLTNPDAGLARQWNPLAPLHINDPVTPFTGLKLRRAVLDGASCRAALQTGAVSFEALEAFEASPQCGIRDRVVLRQVGRAGIAPVETTCAVALRMAMWGRHSLSPAALEILGADIAGIDHLSSYNCRQIRTPGGSGGRMSMHATAEAIDISGFRFKDGRRLRLISDWTGDGPEAAFLAAARDGACQWFATTLGPDYNALHADHFHLQSRGWGTCR